MGSYYHHGTIINGLFCVVTAFNKHYAFNVKTIALNRSALPILQDDFQVCRKCSMEIKKPIGKLSLLNNRSGTIAVLRYSLVSWQGNYTQRGFDFFRKTALMSETNKLSSRLTLTYFPSYSTHFIYSGLLKDKRVLSASCFHCCHGEKMMWYLYHIPTGQQMRLLKTGFAPGETACYNWRNLIF